MLAIEHKAGSAKAFGIQYVGAFNFRYTLFLSLKLGIKYSLTTNL